MDPPHPDEASSNHLSKNGNVSPPPLKIRCPCCPHLTPLFHSIQRKTSRDSRVMEMAPKHTHNNQPVGGSVWEPPGPAGGHGSVPLRPRPEFSWCSSAGSPKTAAGLSWVKKKQKILKQQSTGWRRRVGGAEGLQGATEVTPCALLLMLARRWRRAALDGRNTPPGTKKHQKRAHTTISR